MPYRTESWATARTGLRCAIGLCGLLLLCGCESRGFIDPTEMGRFKKDPLIVPIVSQVDPAAEEMDTQWSNAAEPTADDLKPTSADYRISPNDLLAVYLSDVAAANVEQLRQVRVSESGNIALPLLPEPVHAAGLTEIQLERAIADAYRNAQIVQNANVSVSVLEARGRAFYIIGSIQAPGQYPILQADFRLLDALAVAHDVTSTFVSYIYVIRTPPPPLAPMPALPMNTRPGSRPATGPSSEELAPPRTRADAPAPPLASAALQHAVHLTSMTEQAPESFDGFRAAPNMTRVIRVPFEALRRGELKYNIAIRPFDHIYVQPPEQGFYFMGGHVARPGAFQLTGPKVTLMDAIIGASMLDGLAIPQRTDVIRRINPDHKVFVRVDLARVFAGEEPDIYLKPGDEVIVGTNAFAPFLAAVRGGFRMTYGFGFIYDRNFAYPIRFGIP